MTILDVQIQDKEVLRRRVPLAAVCSALGIKLDSSGYGICPFHEDRRPSFNLWEVEDGTQRWGCFPCGINGDVYDLVRRVRGVGFGESIRFVSDLVGDEIPTVTPRQRVELDVEGLQAYVSGAQRRAQLPENAGLMCVAVGLRDERLTLSERALVDERLRDLGWGVDERCNVIMPHYRPDQTLAGAKVRAIGGAKWAYPGSRFERLYGCWRPNVGSWESCLLVEGETDYAHATLSEPPAHVLSVPSGAKFHDEWIMSLVGFQTVYLALDPDEAGLKAADRWASGLSTIGVRAMKLSIDEGEDLRSCGVPVPVLMETAC